MGRVWTKPQQKVIDNRDRNLLVSAAAGSGKTTVMVARIIKMITDSENPVDIDKLVVITFTRAAAAQMKQKISDELEKLMEKDPENALYRRQQRLIGSANICTIDSFCINIVRSYFQKLELDPAFRIADDTELKLIKSDVMDELMERYHEEGNEDFHYLIEAYCNYRSDEKLTEYIYLLANRAEAQPWPNEWLDTIEADFDVENGEKLSMSNPAKSIFNHVKEMFKGLLTMTDKAKKLCVDGDGAPDYLSAIESDEEGINSILNAADYRDMGERFGSLSFETFSRKKTGIPEIKEKIKAIRKAYKDEIDSIKKSFFPADADETAELIRKSLPAVRCLVRMTKDYLAMLKEKKKEKNVIDFSDAEHFALEILSGDSPEAKELKERFHEIIIDEYQDSNNVQEDIANCIAGGAMTRPYIFTVGDVKQSIYKFRNACPELFIDKQDRYGKGLDNGELIILDNNFRSREEVLESTNALFRHVMRREIGGIDYNDECSLKKGSASQDSSGPDSPYKTEVLLITDDEDECESEESSSEDGTDKDVKTQRDKTDGETEESETGTALEARLVAKRIKMLIQKGDVLVPDEDKEGSMRPVRYSDIVILLRTVKGWASAFAEVFENEGIPVFTEDAEGFFKSQEVRLVVDFLSILDNPCQDIPFAAVLHSVIADLNEEELALIKIYAGNTETFYEASLKVAEDSDKIADAAISFELKPVLKSAADKLHAFFTLYDDLQEYRKSSSVSELIQKIYSDTGLYNYFSACPDGEKRKANLDMLPGYAVDYENTSYSGLFSFIRYYEKLKNRELDYGEAGARIAGNCVRIMSIHKSKGLEFPVVFVSGLGKKFNMGDLSGDIIVSSQHGLGIKYVDIENRIKYPSFYHSVIAMRGKEDLIGEEMRLLYVAMTRAKDKIIMTGRLKKPNESTDYASLFGAKNFMDFVYPVIGVEKEHFAVQMIPEGEVYSYGAEYPDEVPHLPENDNEALPEGGGAPDMDELKARLLQIRSAQYPYSGEQAVPVKLSVSELKHMQIEEEFGENMFEETREFKPGDKTLPDFLKAEDATTSGTGYGTLVHKCMQFMPPGVRDSAGIEEFLAEMVFKKRITDEERRRLPVKKFVDFMNDNVADRMRKAYEQGKLYREKQFMITMSAGEIDPVKFAGSEVPVPVQGVIDAMFIEDGEIVILDYKTDSLKPGEEEKLVRLYSLQLDIYARAAERLLGRKVKEKLLYSFSLGKTIVV